VSASGRTDLGPQGFIYPMPMTLVGADLESGPNFMPIAWINRVQMAPPRVAAGMNKHHATNAGIREHGEFSVSIPSAEMIERVDWCGLVSAGRGVDKAAAFTIVRGQLEHAPMIAECPLSLECRVAQVVDLGSHELFIAEIVATWADDRVLDENGKPDVMRMRPFVLTMPDNRYWGIGDYLGPAWSVGKGFVPGE
jgi:flavin reductase (DIM6/NTAB) family NADH-FMN oxidoreductase RutF